MPRRSDKVQQNPKTKQATIEKDFFGDESEEGEYLSPDTDDQQTDYNLDDEPSTSKRAKRTPLRISPRLLQSGSNRSSTRPTSTGTHNRKQKKPQKNQQANFFKDYRKLMERTKHMVPKLPFSRLIREILISSSTEANRITVTGLIALQEAAEAYLTQLFQDSYACTIHRNRVTLTVRDMRLVRFLRGPSDIGALL